MKSTAGFYSVIQFCPDPSRMEAANVGVLLFCPERQFIEALTSRDNRLARRLSRRDDFDPDRLNSAKEAIEHRLHVSRAQFRTLEDLARFADTRSNELRLTAPRPMKVSDPQADLKALFAELVGGRSQAAPKLEVFMELDRAFRCPDIASRMQFDMKVEIPLLGRSCRFPYAYQNGRLNLIRPERFPTHPEDAVSLAARWAIRGDLLQRHGASNGVSRTLVFIPALPEQLSSDVGSRIRDVLSEYRIRVVETPQIANFVQEVAAQAH